MSYVQDAFGKRQQGVITFMSHNEFQKLSKALQRLSLLRFCGGDGC